MLVTDEIRENISSMTHSRCSSQLCQAELVEMRESLLNALGSDRITEFEPGGNWFLNGIHRRPVYNIVRDDGHRLKIAFTRLSNIMVFSSRGRATHCRPEEFQQRLQKFLSG